MTRRRCAAAACLILSAILLTGCLKRNLHIISDPPGATVYFNEEEVGTTPLDYDFIFYAVHKVEVKKEGYKSLATLENLKPPIYALLPLDFFTEIIPRDFWDRKELSYVLSPLPVNE
ncbi:MAG: PEGA domain-containing protein [Candidatus Omnitrophota bacterium]